VFLKEEWRITKATISKFIFVSSLLLVFPSADFAQESWKFIVTCDSRDYDTGFNLTIVSELANEIVSHDVDFVLYPGDIVTNNSPFGPVAFETLLQAWVETLKPVYDAGIAVYPCRGNHELCDVWNSYPFPGTSPDPNDNNMLRWLNVFGNDSYPQQKLPDNGPANEKYMTYSVTHKNAFIVVLDQYAGIRHDFHHRINQKWLDDQLAANIKPHIFIAGHESAFRTLHTDCLDNFPAERDAFWASIKNAGGLTYFCGHDHYYDHSYVDDGDGNPDNNIHQLIVATAGASLYTWSPPYNGNNSSYDVEQIYHSRQYGYLLVEVDELNVTLTWIERNSYDLNIPGIYEPNNTWSYTANPKPILLQPNGGENLRTADTYTITWKTPEGVDIDNVLIGYSLDNGQTWQKIISWPNSGSYEWNSIPATNSNECLIRISDFQNPLASDISNETFSIFQCPTPLVGDLNKDCYVDFLDFAILAENWLKYANPLDPKCNEQ
jgi:hypothetical protein